MHVNQFTCAAPEHEEEAPQFGSPVEASSEPTPPAPSESRPLHLPGQRPYLCLTVSACSCFVLTRLQVRDSERDEEETKHNRAVRSCRNWWPPAPRKKLPRQQQKGGGRGVVVSRIARAMPLSRHTVRSEYALGGRDLYRGADQHDPEAVLDGAAMAGLVGVLRQLGDLAEYVRHTVPVSLALSFVRHGIRILLFLSRFRGSSPVSHSFLIFLDELLMPCASNCCVLFGWSPRPMIAFAWIFGPSRRRSPNAFVM
jgi:hypothetical protein